MAHDLSPGKSVCILAIVVGCFAILWPNIFYPMLKGSVFNTPVDTENGCCDVLLYNDVNGVKLVSELCSMVLKLSENYHNSVDIPSYRLSKDAIKHCRNVVLDTCGVDIHILLKDKIQLNPTYKHTLEELRTFNKSLCLKYHFDVTLDLLGTPHRVKKFNTSVISMHIHQERSPYLRPNTLHPAFRERGRAVPQPHATSRVQREREKESPPPAAIAAKKPPIPGMRPPIGGGAGHIPTQKGSGPMGILMPLYTIGIVIFFGYTIMRLVYRKQDNSNNYAHDPEFCRYVFNNNVSESKHRGNEKNSNNFVTEASSNLVVSAISSLLQEVNRDILEREKHDVKDENYVIQRNESADFSCENTKKIDTNGTDVALPNDEPENLNETTVSNSTTEKVEKVNGVIEVIGMETKESCENGRPWKCSTQLPSKVVPPVEVVTQEIILSGNVPVNSQILISDAHTENVATESSVILESKVTLNVISPELNNEVISENGHVNGDELKQNCVRYENSTTVSEELHVSNGNIKNINNKKVSEETDEEENDFMNSEEEYLKDEPNTEL